MAKIVCRANEETAKASIGLMLEEAGLQMQPQEAVALLHGSIERRSQRGLAIQADEMALLLGITHDSYS